MQIAMAGNSGITGVAVRELLLSGQVGEAPNKPLLTKVLSYQHNYFISIYWGVERERFQFGFFP